MASPNVECNSASLGGWTTTENGIDVLAGETVSVRLIDSAGIRLWNLDIVGVDDLVVAPAISQAGSVSGTATFTAPASPADGWALRFRSRVGVYALGFDLRSQARDDYTATFGVFLPTGEGVHLASTNETSEQSSEFGWVKKWNELARRAPATGTGVPTGRTLTTTTPIRIDGGASADLSANRTISLVPGTVAGRVLGWDGASWLERSVVVLTGITVSTLGLGVVHSSSGGVFSSSLIVNADVDAAAAIAVSKLAPGSNGQAIVTAGGVATWGTVTAGSVSPGTARQIYFTNATPLAEWITASGDISVPTTAGVFRVDRINGTAVTTAGGGAVGAVLRMTGSATSDWGAVNLADTDAITGLLPLVNLTPGSNGQFLSTIGGVATWAAVTISSITPGAANTVLTTNGAGNATAWATIVNANVDAAAGIVVTKLAPGAVNTVLITNASGVIEWAAGVPGGGTLVGDVTGPLGSNVVERIHGATVPIAGSLTTGNGLYVSGASALTYSALNLGGGSEWVTGALPLANIAQGGAITGNALVWSGTVWAPGVPTGIGTGSITPGTVGQWLVTAAGPTTSWVTATGGDWTGAITTNTVVGLTGTIGVVAMHGDAITWDIGATPLLSQVARASDAATHNFTLRSQGPFGGATSTNRNPGNFLFEIPSPASGGTPGFFKFAAGVTSSARVALGAYNSSGSPPDGGDVGGAVWLGVGPAGSPSTNIQTGSATGNYTIGSNGTSNVRINVPGGVGSAAAFEIWMLGALSHAHAPGSIGFGEVSPTGNVLFAQSQRTTDAAVHDMYMSPQAPFATATGTNRNAARVIFSFPSPIGAGVAGGFLLQYGTNEHYFQKDKWTIFQSAGSPTWTAGTAVPTASEVDGSRYTRTGSPNGDEYVRRNGAWVSLTTGTTVTLAGDVTGPSGANVVVGLTGTAGVVAMHGTSIRSTAGLALEIASGPGTPPAAFNLRRGTASAFLAADGSGSGEFVQVDGGQSVYLDAVDLILRTDAGVPKATWTTAGISFDALLSAVTITQAADAGTGATTTIAAQSSTNSVGGQLTLTSGGGGGGNVPGNLNIILGGTTAALTFIPDAVGTPTAHVFCDGIRWDKTLDAPTLWQEGHTANELPATLVIRSQAPAPGVTATGDNRLAGDIYYEVPASTNGADELGTHVWWIGEGGVAGDGKVLTLRADSIEPSVHAILFELGDSTSAAFIRPIQIASGNDGHGMEIHGGAAGAGDQDGGPVILGGGPPSGTGLWGQVTIDGPANAMVKVMSKDATHHAIALCGDPAAADLPTNFTNYVYVGESAGAPNAFSGGFLLASIGGCPYFCTEAGNEFIIEGTVSGTAGAIVEYMQVQVGVNARKIAVYAMS